MAWRDDLPAIRAENAAWAAEHLPRARERQAAQAARRNRVKTLLRTALDATEATDEQRAEVFAVTGVAA